MANKSASPKKTFYQTWGIALVCATLLCVPMVFTMAGIAVQSNVNRVEDWLPKSFEETKNLAWFRQHFASDQFIIVSWQGCEIGATAQQDDVRLERLARLLVPQDTDARRQHSAELDPVPPVDAAARQRYFKAVVTGRHLLDRLTDAPLSLPRETAIQRLQGTMIGPDSKQTCLIVTLHGQAMGELKQVLGSGQRRIFRESIPPGILRRLVAQAGIPEADLHLGGPPVDNSAIDEEGERTLVRLAGVSGLLGLALAWWSLRSVILTLLVFFCGVMSAAASLAIVAFSGQNVDAILMSMPSLVYVLAISGAVHLVNYHREAVQAEGLHGAVERAVKHAWKPALLCSVTTAIGLLSLSVSELVPIRKFGTFSAAGVMSLVAIVYLFLPAALQVTGIGRRWLTEKNRGNQSHAASSDESFGIRLWAQVATKIVLHYRTVMLACVAVTIVLGLGIAYTKSSIDLLKLFDHQAKILQDYRWLEAHLGKLVPLEIIIRFPAEIQREQAEGFNPSSDWSDLSFIQRLETVMRMQTLIDREFGPAGKDLVGHSMSAATFAPILPASNSGNVSFIQRKAIDARLSRSKRELEESGFLKIDPQDNSELWRVSLRVAAFKNVDYGRFVDELRKITHPLLEAYQARALILHQLSQQGTPLSPVGKKILVWSYEESPEAVNSSGHSFQHILWRLLEENRCMVQTRNEDPRSTPLTELESLKELDSVLAIGDFSDAMLETVRAFAPTTIDARLLPSTAFLSTASLSTVPLSTTQTAITPAYSGPAHSASAYSAPAYSEPASEAGSLSVVFTGVVPIIYQAQRSLLNSLTESTWWSFLTITPIMMLVSRSILAGGVAMLPNAVPVLLVFGGMGWLQVPIDIGSMMTASIALGVAVDDTIHFLARYRQELAYLPDRRSAIISTYSHCAVPTLQAALISGLGLSVFAFSTFTPTQRFGWLMLCILFAGVAAELIFLPAILASPLGRVFGDPSKAREQPCKSAWHPPALRPDDAHGLSPGARPVAARIENPSVLPDG